MRLKMQATAKDLRFHSTDLLNTVKRGEEVVISYHGKTCAKLVPIEDKTEILDSEDENELFGIWSDNDETKDVIKYSRNARKGRVNAD